MQDQPTSQSRKPGTWQSAVTLTLGILTPCTLGLAGIPGTFFGIYALKRGGFRIMTAIGLALSLLFGGVLMTTITGPYLWAKISPHYAASRALKGFGQNALPSGAADVQHQKQHGILLGGDTLWGAVTCNPAEAKAYADASPINTPRTPIGPDFDPDIFDSYPAWFRPDQATSGWHTHSSVPHMAQNPKWGWREIVYDNQSGRLYIMVYRY